MNGGVEFNGMFGAFILMATPIVMSVVTLISLVVYLTSRKSGQTGLKWSKYFLISAVIFLLFDGVVLLFVFSNTTTLNRKEAIAFDDWMLLGWVPFHLIGYFLVAVTLRFLRARREPINKFIDKLR